MKALKILFAMAIVLGANCNLFTQDCKDFNQSKFCWIQDAQDYKKYGKSRSAYVLVHQTYKYEVILKDKRDYKIGVCVSGGYEPVQFRIIEKESEKVIYDNSTDNYGSSVGFSVEDKSLTVIIETSVLATKFKPKDNGDNRTCVGIQILYQNFGKLGF
jgi:hypothetical protein